MKIEQIFYRFCKDENVYLLVTKMINQRVNQRNQDIMALGNKSIKLTNAKDYFYYAIKRFGLRELFSGIFGYYWSPAMFYLSYPKMRNVVKKWRYLVDKNIFVNPNSLKIDDKVIVNNCGLLQELEIYNLSKDFSFIAKHKPSCNKYSIFDITSVNGNESNINFYVKRKNKTYGLD